MILYKVAGSEYFRNNATGLGLGVNNKALFCKISNKNIIAYTVIQDAETCVYVGDMIVLPYISYKICSSTLVMTSLEWNHTGELLLMTYDGGYIEVWSSPQNILNTWTLTYKGDLLKEDIICAKFFHSGKSVYFNSQKKEMSLYAEKFERLPYRPTLVNFGNAAVEGGIVVTASGLLGIFAIYQLAPVTDNNNATQQNQCTELKITAHRRLGLARTFIRAVNLLHNQNGDIIIAVNYAEDNQMVNLFKVSIRFDYEQNIIVKCESLPSVFLTKITSRSINHIRIANFNNEDIVLIASKVKRGYILEQWNLVKKTQMIHKFLQKTKGDLIQLENWELTAKMHFKSEIADICLTRLFTDAMQISVVLADNNVQIFETGLKKVNAISFERFADNAQCKFSAADVTHLNQILLILDNMGQIYAMQMPNQYMDKGYKPNTIALQVSYLEYSIVTGIDASDILLLNLINLDLLIEKLTENFTRQPAYTRHYYYSNFLSLKSNMCRMQSKQQDFDDLIMLHSISITFKSLLRPSSDNQEKGPADNLAMILSEPLIDIDKVLLNLEAKEFTVEPLTLQSMQQLIQWVADLALNILNRLPEDVIKTKLNKKQGYDISRDLAAIGSLRELLVMIRIWGLLTQQCLPIYSKSVDNIDVLAILFRLLTRLSQNPSEPDEMILDECSSLSTQVLIPKKHLSNPTTLLNCHMSVVKSFPLQFTRFAVPVLLQDTQFEEVVFNCGTKDGVSNIHLGSKSDSIRKCIRCGFVHNSQKNAKTSALKAWVNRWIYCHCGGFWKTM